MKLGSCDKTERYDPSLQYNSHFHSQQTKILLDFFRFILDSSFLKNFQVAFAHKQQPVDPQRWVGLTLTLSLTC